MPLTELRKIIQNFKNTKDATPIALSDTAAYCYAVQELTDASESVIYVFIFFDENGESSLFEAMSDDKTSETISKHLQCNKVSILTNDTAKVKKLPFSNCSANLKISPIPNKLANVISSSNLDNEFFLAGTENIIFIGRYNIQTKEKLLEARSFLNMFDKGFHDTLLSFYQKIISRAESGDFR